MDKAFLKELGIEDENITKIIKAHNEEIKDSYVPLSRFNAVNEDKKEAERKAKELKSQLDGLDNVDVAELENTIETLKNENKTAQENHEKELRNIKIDYALDKALIDAKANNIKDIDDKIKALAEDDTTSFLFGSDESSKGKFKGVNPVQVPGAGSGQSDDDSVGSMYAQKYNAKFGVTNNENE